jgi:hypothetical protein
MSIAVILRRHDNNSGAFNFFAFLVPAFDLKLRLCGYKRVSFASCVRILLQKEGACILENSTIFFSLRFGLLFWKKL